MKKFLIVFTVLFLSNHMAFSQWCCSTQGNSTSFVLSESYLPQKNFLQIGYYYEYYFLNKVYYGSNQFSDLSQSKSSIKISTLTLEYGLNQKVSLGALVPYSWRERSFYYRDLEGFHFADLGENGIGDVTLLTKYSPIVLKPGNPFQLTLGVAIQIPTKKSSHNAQTGLTDLQSSTGTFSYSIWSNFLYKYGYFNYYTNFQFTYYSVTQNKFKRGSKLSFLYGTTFNLSSFIGVLTQIRGNIQNKDYVSEGSLYSSGGEQIYFAPGLNFKLFSKGPVIQIIRHIPIYQNLEGFQLGLNFGWNLNTLYAVGF